MQLLASTVDGGEPALSIDFDRPTALFIGNEGAGLSPALIAAADFRITIPCPGPVESLNAAVAASVLLYEASRQRSHLVRRIAQAMSLFGETPDLRRHNKSQAAPLAERMRPRTLEEFAGQEHLLGPGKASSRPD